MAPRKRQRGFTLLELVTAMTILALLTSVGIVGYKSQTKNAREAVLKENLFQLNHALEQHRADRGRYPGSLDRITSLGYLRQIPVDPMTNSKDTWTFDMEDQDPDNPEAEVGIFRVRSGSTDLGTNGIPYNEWSY